MKLTEIAPPKGAFSLCWTCRHYNWSIMPSLTEDNMWEHRCAYNFTEVGDDVKDCWEYDKERQNKRLK